MEMIILKSPTQPIESAALYDVYVGNQKRAVRLVAADGFELVREGEEPKGILAVDIPAAYEERLKDYTAIPKVEKQEEPDDEIIPDEPDIETEATEADYITALEELGVQFNG